MFNIIHKISELRIKLEQACQITFFLVLVTSLLSSFVVKAKKKYFLSIGIQCKTCKNRASHRF